MEKKLSFSEVEFASFQEVKTFIETSIKGSTLFVFYSV